MADVKAGKSKQANPRGIAWCYTINNPKSPLPWNEYQMSYHVYGEETGKEGTKHFQGFLVFKNSKSFATVKDLCPQAHWEVAKGTYIQASDYCKKDGVFNEQGTLPEQPQKKGSAAGGQATLEKWRFISDAAKRGDLLAIDKDHPKQFVTSYRNIQSIRKDFTERVGDLDGVCGIWYYGAPGVGKTRLVTAKYPNAYLKRFNKWFDGYNAEETVVLDDLGKEHNFMGYELKKLADRYCYLVEIKNASFYIRPKRCVVTSQFTIAQVWHDDQDTKAALQRRFVEVEVKPGNIELAFALANERLAKKNNQSIVIVEVPKTDDDMTVEEFDSVMEKYNAKEVAAEVLEKMPKKIRPRNTYFPDKPIRFVPYKAPRKLERKNAVVISSSSDEGKNETSEEDVPSSEESPRPVVYWNDGPMSSLHEAYDLLDCSTEEEDDVDE